jgi:NADH:ubiquinone oxidoreductase subunit 5 (subunit L)/multisubunit Na+/H+ antiporter MnhA subunit
LFICNKSNSNLIFKFQKSFINFLIYGLLRGFRILSLTLISVNYFSEVLFIEFNLVSFRSLRLNFIIILDLLSLLFLSAVRVITLAVLKFSESYINNDKNFFRFHLLLLLFVFRMYFLILSPNLIRLLLG